MMSIFRNNKNNNQTRLNAKRIYALRETIELAKDPQYAHYEFLPVDPDDIKKGYRAIPREELRSSFELVEEKIKMDKVQEKSRHREIEKEINRNRKGKLYNDYQSAKGYKKPREYKSK